MPKVSQEYIDNKRAYIRECAIELFKEKSVYDITMRDIISKTGFSQGNIYRYYKSVLSIFADCVNSLVPRVDTQAEIERIICESSDEKTRICKVFMFICEFIQGCIDAVGDKMYFELNVLALKNLKEWEGMQGTVEMRTATQKIIAVCAGMIQKGIESGKYAPKCNQKVFMEYICVSIDGIVYDCTAARMNGVDGADMKDMFGVLAETVITMLDIKE